MSYRRSPKRSRHSRSHSRSRTRDRDYRDDRRSDRRDDRDYRDRGSSKQPSTKHSDEDQSSASDDDMNIDKQLYPLSHYVKDRRELLNQAFKIIGEAKLTSMCSSGLRSMPHSELKSLCLEQLEGMSNKRVKYVLAGREMEDSSATEDSGEESQNDDEEGGMAGSLVDIIKPAILNKSPNRSKNSKTPEATIEIQDSPENKDEENEDLSDVIGNAKKAKDLSKKQKVDINYGLKVKSSDGDKGEPVEKQKIMELLELEMRARAIKSLLSRTKGSDTTAETPEPEEPKKEEVKKSEKTAKTPKKEEDDEKVPLLKSDPLEYQREMEEKKRIHKAREALSISMAKKRKEEQEEQDRLDEIQRRIDEQKAREKAIEDEKNRIQAEEDEKIRKKQEKEEERVKFLKWKEEKEKKTKERKVREEEEYDQRATQNLRKKKAEMAEKELEEKQERAKLTQETEMKKRKIVRENVEDELDRDFEVTFDYENEGDQEQSDSKKRRYRRKEQEDEGQIMDYDDSSDDSRRRRRYHSRSRSRSSARSDTSLSLTDSEDESKVEKLRKNRLERVKEIKESKRKRKAVADIEDGEVDSEGEHFIPVEKEKEEQPEKVATPKKETESPNFQEQDSNSVPMTSATPEADEKSRDVKESSEKMSNFQEECLKFQKRRETKDEIASLKEFIGAQVQKYSAIFQDEDDQKPETKAEESMEKVENPEEPEQYDPENESESNQEAPNQDFSDYYVDQDASKDETFGKNDDDTNDKTESDVQGGEQQLGSDEEESQSSLKDNKQKYQQGAWMARHQNRRKSVEKEPDYDFKTKRQIVVEQEYAPEPEMEDEMDDDEEKARLKQEAKEKEKKRKQAELRLQRMQRFEARSELQEVETEDAFYKSWNKEEEERLKQEEETEQAPAETATDEPTPETSNRPVYVEVKKDQPTRDPEISEKEGVGYILKVCGEKGDFEDKPEPPKVEEPPPKKKKEEKKQLTRGAKIFRGSKDLPSKAQVDADQAEQDTWKERYLQNSSVKKIQQESGLLSKMKKGIKIKSVDNTTPTPEAQQFPGTSAKDLKAEALRRKAIRQNPQNTDLPIVGNLDEYSKLAKTTTTTETPKETKVESSDESDEDEGDEIWGTIMGKK